MEDDHPAILCPYCKLWSHNKCNDIKRKEYKVHQNIEDEPFCCQKCFEHIPFNGLNSNEFVSFIKFDVIETRNGSNVKLTPTPSQQIIIDKLNNLITQTNTRIIYDDEDDYDEPNFNQPLLCSYYSCPITVVYQRPNMNTTDFVETKLTRVVDKLAKEKKQEGVYSR